MDTLKKAYLKYTFKLLKRQNKKPQSSGIYFNYAPIINMHCLFYDQHDKYFVWIIPLTPYNMLSLSPGYINQETKAYGELSNLFKVRRGKEPRQN